MRAARAGECRSPSTRTRTRPGTASESRVTDRGLTPFTANPGAPRPGEGDASGGNGADGKTASGDYRRRGVAAEGEGVRPSR
jgi:hypothetical protein